VDEIRFEIKGSAADPYEVLFIKDGTSLTAICSCPAGQFSNVCKHRLAILAGDGAAITSGNGADVQTVVAWLPGTDVEAALMELHAAESLSGKEKKPAVDKAKRNLARVMNR